MNKTGAGMRQFVANNTNSGVTQEGIQAGAAVLFHCKVAGSVPEPASAGPLVAGVVLMRSLVRRKR
ncbi:MAG: hypothetical protein U1F77_17420 [Kiritimatiellia bacterium]